MSETLQFETEAEREFWHDVYLREVDSNFPETALAKTDAALLEFRARSAKLREGLTARLASMRPYRAHGPVPSPGEACKHPGCPGTLVVGALGLQCSACGPCLRCQEFPGPAGVCRCGKPAASTACAALNPGDDCRCGGILQATRPPAAYSVGCPDCGFCAVPAAASQPPDVAPGEADGSGEGYRPPCGSCAHGGQDAHNTGCSLPGVPRLDGLACMDFETTGANPEGGGHG